jgi:hypothetical protein
LRDDKGLPVANRAFSFYCQPLNDLTQLPLLAAEMEARNLPYEVWRRAHTNAEGKVVLYPFCPALWSITATEQGTRIPFQGQTKAIVTEDGAKITMPVALNPNLED